MVRTAHDELLGFIERRGAVVASGLLELARSKFRGSDARQKALSNMARVISHTLMLSDLYGRRRTLLEADWVGRKRQPRFAEIGVDVNPIDPLPFTEAVEDLVDRDPRLASGWREVSRMYTESHAFAMARSADLNVTRRVQSEIEKLMREGKSTYDVEQAILDIGQSSEMGAVRDWTRSYAATVYRTNASTGYNNGRFVQAFDPVVRDVIPALEFAATLDDRTRPNHRAAHGLIAGVEDPIWRYLRPPLAWQCRCAADFVDRFELEDRGLIEGDRVKRYEPPTLSQARPDEGFRPGEFSF